MSDEPLSIRAICWLETASDDERKDCITALWRQWPQMMVAVAGELGYTVHDEKLHQGKIKHVVGVLENGEEIVIYD